MPLRDGTGPTGAGSRTGRGSGNCAGQGGAGRFGGLRPGMGHGRRGRGLGFSPEQERSWLEPRAMSLQAAWKSITERLDALKKE